MTTSLPALFKGYREAVPGPLQRRDRIIYDKRGGAWQAYRWPEDAQCPYLLAVWTPEMTFDCWRMERSDPAAHAGAIAAMLGFSLFERCPTQPMTREWLLW